MDKIKGKFYPLQHEEWLKAFKELTDTEKGVLYYLRTLDPYSNGLRVRASKIASDLEISRQSVYKAFDVLEQKRYIQREDVEYTIKIVSHGLFGDTSITGTNLSADSDSVNSSRRQSKQRDIRQSVTTSVKTAKQKAPKTPAVKETQAPKINKTFEDFKDSLSVEERESFLEFGLKMAADLPKPPQLPKKWITKNWEEVRDKWLQAGNKPSCEQTHKWADHSNREEWLNEINQLGAVSFMCDDEGNVDPERKEFFEWAEKANLIE
jgi:hypothetical protein